MIQRAEPASLIVRQAQPFNAGPPLDQLRQSFITRPESFFVRSHGTVPAVSAEAYQLTIDGMVERPLQLSLNALRTQFPTRTIVATLQCAGNRRAELADLHPLPDELPWDAEAVGTAIWRGVALGEVLRAAGVTEQARHVAFTGLDEVVRADRRFGFGGSIPIEKAINAEVLLAYEMNDRPLSPLHGYPLRVVVPGYIGARSVKWLAGITLQEHPSTNYFQTHAYRLAPAGVDATSSTMLGSFPVNAVICRPQQHAMLRSGPTLIQGYALTGDGHRIERVELSVDRGRTWQRARILEHAHPWAWCFWERWITLHPGEHQISVRAWDSAGYTQPADLERVWNPKGYLNNAWHQISVCAFPRDSVRH